MDDRKRLLLLVALLAAIALIELRSLLFLGQTFFRADVSYNIEPSCYFTSTFFWQHHCLAMWNPWILCGVSQVAASWPLLYPPSYIGLLLFAPFGLGTGYYLLFHLMTAGIGGYLWQRSCFENEDSDAGMAIFFALAFMLNGYMFGATINLSLMAAASWTPLALFFVDGILRAPRWWKCGALALVLGMQFAAGRPEIALGAFLLYTLRLLLNLSKSPAPRRSALLVILSMVLSAVLNAGNICPLFELLMNSPSATENSVFKATFWSTGWRDWLSMLIPLPYGKLNMNSDPDAVTYAGAIPYLVSLFLGPVIITLSAFELSVGVRKNLFWIGFMLLMICLCLGEFGPLGFIYLHQNLIRYPIKFGIFVIFSLLVVAARGWRRLGKGEILQPTKVIACVWFGILIAAAGFNFPPNITGKWQLIAVSILGMGTCLLARATDQRGWRKWLLAVGAIAPLLVNCEFQLSDLAPERVFLSTSSVAHFIKSTAQMDRKQYRVLALIDNSLLPPSTVGSAAEPLDQSFTKYCREILRPNCNVDFEVQTSNGMSVVPTWTSLFFDTGLLPRSTLTPIQHPLGKSNVPLFRFCQATSTAFVIATNETEDDSGNWSPSPLLDEQLFKLVRIDKHNNVRIYKVLSFRPRASIISAIKYVPDRTEALKYINRSDVNGYDPLHEVILTGAPPAGQPQTAPVVSKTDANYATVVEDNNDSLRIEAKCDKPAMLVITDGFYPGWEAYDNGKRTEILLADGVLRAIPMQPGVHHIDLNFLPKSMMYGTLISMFAIALAGALLLTGLRRKRI